MTTKELEQKILDIILDRFEIQYTGGIRVEERTGAYVLKLYMGRDFLSPMQFYVQGDEDFFLEYIEDEFIRRNIFNCDINRFYKGGNKPDSQSNCKC